MQFGKVGHELSFVNIFTIIQLMAVFKYDIYLAGLGFGVYFELKVIFERFCTIFNIEDKRMLRIDHKSKSLISYTEK